MTRYTLSRKADDDLVNAVTHSVQQFGIKQTNAYFRALNSTFDMLAEHKEAGSLQPELQDGIRRFTHQRHTIFYTVRENDVLIVRILGPGQDPIRAFNP